MSRRGAEHHAMIDQRTENPSNQQRWGATVVNVQHVIVMTMVGVVFKNRDAIHISWYKLRRNSTVNSLAPRAGSCSPKA